MYMYIQSIHRRVELKKQVAKHSLNNQCTTPMIWAVIGLLRSGNMAMIRELVLLRGATQTVLLRHYMLRRTICTNIDHLTHLARGGPYIYWTNCFSLISFNQINTL